MKLSAIKTECANDYFTLIEIRKSPGNSNEYIGLLYGRDGKSFMLCDEDESVISKQDLGDIVNLLKEAGFKNATIYF